MLVFLPPSETKRPGGTGSPLAWDGLSLPTLTPQREQVTAALVQLCADEETAARVLKLSPRQRGDIAQSAAMLSAPTMPAIERYTGVLFDAIGVEQLDDQARAWLGCSVMIQSAPFGPIGACDAIPAYRLAAGTSLPGLPALRRVWAEPVTAAWEVAAPDFVLDMRSEAYVALGPVPPGITTRYVHVVTRAGDGEVRALNHFNKHAKGQLVGALARAGVAISGPEEFVAWAREAGFAVDDDGVRLRLWVRSS